MSKELKLVITPALAATLLSLRGHKAHLADRQKVRSDACDAWVSSNNEDGPEEMAYYAAVYLETEDRKDLPHYQDGFLRQFLSDSAAITDDELRAVRDGGAV